jgi:hypothetical protein
MGFVVPLIHVQERQITTPFCVSTLPEEINVLSPRSDYEQGYIA